VVKGYACLILLCERFLLALQHFLENLFNQEVGACFRSDAEFLRSRGAVIDIYGHFRTSGTWEAAIVKAIDPSRVISAQRPGAFKVSEHQIVHDLFGGQRSPRLNRGRVRCLPGGQLPQADAHQDLYAHQEEMEVDFHR